VRRSGSLFWRGQGAPPFVESKTRSRGKRSGVLGRTHTKGYHPLRHTEIFTVFQIPGVENRALGITYKKLLCGRSNLRNNVCPSPPCQGVVPSQLAGPSGRKGAKQLRKLTSSEFVKTNRGSEETSNRYVGVRLKERSKISGDETRGTRPQEPRDYPALSRVTWGPKPHPVK